METNLFLKVFSKLKLSANVNSVLKNVKVLSIRMDSYLKELSITLESDEILNESCLKDLEEDIFKNFEYMLNVNIFLKYNIKEFTPNLIINIKKNILENIKEESLICYEAMKNSDFNFEENILNIKLEHNNLYVLNSKKISQKIKDFIKERFDKNIEINFIKSEKSCIKNVVECFKPNDEPIAVSLEKIHIENNQPFFEKPKNNQRFSLKVKDIAEDATKIKDSIKNLEKVTVFGEIFNINITETKKGKYIVKVDITDKTGSVSFKFFSKPEVYEKEFSSIIKKGNFINVKGTVQYDEYAKELVLMAREICKKDAPKKRMDSSENKRIELHLHTQMSKMDGVSSVKDLIKRASDWGHKAIAITDHGVVQAFPEAMEISKKLGIKVIYGVEAYVVDDLANVVQNSKNQSLDETYVVFDLETTGLNRELNKIIEIGAVKIQNGKIIERFSSFVNPHEPLSEKIIDLTKITDEMLKDAPEEKEVLPKFFEFFKDSILVAHNAGFDMGFIKKWAERNSLYVKNTVLDTVGLSRTLFPEMARHTLNVLAKKLNVSLKNHHRAVDDAEATANIFLKCIPIILEKGITTLDGINELARVNIDVKKLRPSHAIILAKNQVGLRNLYELISISHLNYFFKTPRIPKSEILRLRDGLILGTACDSGEFFQAVLNNQEEEDIEKIADFYDYFEIQPLNNNFHYIYNEKFENIKSEEDIKNINKKIVAYGEKYNKKVVATGDVHFLEPEDKYFREIIQAAQGFKDCENQPELFFKTTEEMLDEFKYLGEEKAFEVVVKNTNYISDLIEDILPIPEGTFPPNISGADVELKKIALNRAKSIYGEDLPKIVKSRLERELNSIIGNGFAVLYIISQKIVAYSNDNGYIVGSRGSVGSSFVATMAGITEVNPLSPHYFCKNCKYSDFDSDEVLKNAGNSGWDLPNKTCPNCGENLSKDGHDIPFETFLGFNGDKEPDIDLNFSGEFQQEAHTYTEELFGKDFVFKAGTIGTLADKTAFGFVKKYLDERNKNVNSAEVTRLVNGCIGIKRTTGQHPGGLMVVPNNKSIYDFCPVQHPADDSSSDIITTHFDYHSISGRILKLDLLGHDVPTILRMLKEFTGFDPLDVPMDDKKTMSLFTSADALNLNEDIFYKTGSLGLPEFGTPFVMQMLLDTMPTTFSELVRISGLSHGTDVWFNNAQDLIKNEVATLKEVIPTRDDIMVYLVIKGIENETAFKIMESVRKGKGLSPEFEKEMLDKNVPNWYIDSCKKIKYMFPKGHAVAYVTNAFRIGYFKVNYPTAFYAALFSVKVEDFDYETMCFGIEKVSENIKEIQALGKKATAKEKNKLVILELVQEMYARGITFDKMDLYKSRAFKFDVTNSGILPPLCALQGLGKNAATKIVSSREEHGKFETIEILEDKTGLGKSVIDLLRKNDVLKNMPETNQLSLF